VSTPNAMELPAGLLDAVRQQLELARRAWQDRLRQAHAMLKSIDARLDVRARPQR
jgi:hypothetical protein